MTDKELKDAASATPDPDRALKNLQSFREINPDYAAYIRKHIKPIALLFSFSQFLSNFVSSNPLVLRDAINDMDKPLTKEALTSALSAEIKALAQPSREDFVRLLRTFKKKGLLLITLRDVLNKADMSETMQELSFLAEVIVEEAVTLVKLQLRETYGAPPEDAFAVIAVGKLGGNELNFSSDIDLLYVYGAEQDETSGIMRPGGVIANRISNHEYYCKMGESLSKFLSANTGDGFAYRVDLRLRPEGQRGSLAMSLSAYEIYYESWGRAWERAVFLRARPIAGDVSLGREFLEMIRPFVYRKYLDFSAIDEIKNMKIKIDATFKKDDIKRGYGGIREIEFFAQALQLIYGGREPLLRERNLLKVLHLLLQKNLIGRGDYSTLSDSYIFLRSLEHRLQQLNDLQTHSLPADGKELDILGRKMGFSGKETFIPELEKRRRAVRSIYDSLFNVKDKKEASQETAAFFSEELSDSDMLEIIRQYPLKDTALAMHNIRHIKDSTHTFQTLRSRRHLDEILPAFLLEALKSRNPDAAINNLQAFAELLASEESYLELFAGNKALIPPLVHIFSQSEYLSKTIVKRKEYLELLGHELFLKNTLYSLKERLRETIKSSQSLTDSIRILRQMEEIRFGLLFLDGQIDSIRLVKELSKTAETIVSVCLEELSVDKGLAVIGLGKAGGRELTFSSDLDLIFISERSADEANVKSAERLLRVLSSYTKDGPAYRTDTRLRPEGSRGPIISSLSALEAYYLTSAHFWEFQALLKARPLAGGKNICSGFFKMQKDILIKKGSEVSAADIRAMRERIQKELSREADGYDIKLGAGGLEELEFAVQYLQLKNCRSYPNLIVQGTLDALRRLTGCGLINPKEYHFLKNAYLFYRTLESFMRLSGETVLKKESRISESASAFMGFEDNKEFFARLDETKRIIRDTFEGFLV